MTEPMTNTASNFICFQLTGPICSTAAARGESGSFDAVLGPGAGSLAGSRTWLPGAGCRARDRADARLCPSQCSQSAAESPLWELEPCADVLGEFRTSGEQELCACGCRAGAAGSCVGSTQPDLIDLRGDQRVSRPPQGLSLCKRPS